MRRTVVAVIGIATACVTAPARAQTYDPDYPVCMQVFGPLGGYFDCSYFRLEQCRFLAAGRPAMCIENPYYAPKKPTASKRRPKR